MEASLFWIIILAVSVPFAKGNPVAHEQDQSTNEIEKDTSDVVVSSFAKCSQEKELTGLINCAAIRALKILQHAAKTQTFELFPGVALTRYHSNHFDEPQAQREAKAIADEQLPADPKQKTDRLFSLIVDATTRFFSGRFLKIKIPEVTSTNIARAIEEGRGKRKKGMSPLLLGLGAKALLFKALLILGLGLMSVKALILSKIAFAIAVVLAAGSLFNGVLNFKNIGTPYLGGHSWLNGWTGGSGYGPSYSYGSPGYSPGWTTNTLGGWGNSQYPYARSIDNVTDEMDEPSADAQNMAYANQKP